MPRDVMQVIIQTDGGTDGQRTDDGDGMDDDDGTDDGTDGQMTDDDDGTDGWLVG